MEKRAAMYKAKKGIMKHTYAAERIKKLHLVFRYKVRARLVADIVKKYLPAEGHIRLLDFGCADGLTLLDIRNLLGKGEYTGIEYSEELLRYAPERIPDNVKLYHGDATKLPHHIMNDYYEVVTALAFLEHLTNPIMAVKEAYRVLKPGGLFIATSPVPFWEKLSKKLGLLKEEHHQTDIKKNEMARIIGNAGFKPAYCRQFMNAPLGVLPYLHIPVSPGFSLAVDSFLSRIKILNWLFVNQAFIARKP